MLLAITVDNVKTIALGGIIAVVFLGIASALLMRAVIAKVISLVLTVVIAGALWTQRTNAIDCFERVRDDPDAGATCTFFGRSVDLPDIGLGDDEGAAGALSGS